MKNSRIYLLALCICSCTLFPKEETLLKKFFAGTRSFEVYYVALGATTNDVIQVKEVLNKDRKIIKSIEGYNHVLDLQLEGERTLVLILSDTSYYANKPDTLRIELELRNGLK
jgi:hypothetical protein